MSNQTTGTSPPTLRAQQIIFGALIGGVVVFTVVALVVGPQMSKSATAGQPPLDVLRLACGVLIIATLAAFPVVKRAHFKTIVNQSRWSQDRGEIENAEAFLPAFATISIIGGALSEGPALFGAVILLLSANPLDLLLVVIPLAVLVWRFPTRGQWEAFVLGVDRERALRRGD